MPLPQSLEYFDVHYYKYAAPLELPGCGVSSAARQRRRESFWGSADIDFKPLEKEIKINWLGQS
jgi:hypothetical protein